MNQYKGRWSEDRQLVWQPLGKGESLTLEIPVDTTGKFEIKAKFTMAPDYGHIRPHGYPPHAQWPCSGFLLQ